MTTVKDNATEFEPCPEGLHNAVCVDQVDLGEMDTAFGRKHKIKLVFQVAAVNPKTGKRFEVHQRYNATLNEKATLSKHLESWRGRKFTKEERKGFELEKVIGLGCQLQVTHNIADGTTYANVGAIVRAAEGQAKLEPDYVRQKDRTAKDQTPVAPDADGDIPF